MSTRKRKPILGPDGKPYVAPPKPPEPKAETPREAVERAAEVSGSSFANYTGMSFYDEIVRSMLKPIYDEEFMRGGKAKKPLLRSAVENQVEAILATVPDDWHGGEELPRQPVDLTTYADAFAAARAACGHSNYEDTMYAKREAKCLDCGRYFTKPRGLFGF